MWQFTLFLAVFSLTSEVSGNYADPSRVNGPYSNYPSRSRLSQLMMPPPRQQMPPYYSMPQLNLASPLMVPQNFPPQSFGYGNGNNQLNMQNNAVISSADAYKKEIEKLKEQIRINEGLTNDEIILLKMDNDYFMEQEKVKDEKRKAETEKYNKEMDAKRRKEADEHLKKLQKEGNEMLQKQKALFDKEFQDKVNMLDDTRIKLKREENEFKDKLSKIQQLHDKGAQVIKDQIKRLQDDNIKIQKEIERLVAETRQMEQQRSRG